MNPESAGQRDPDASDPAVTVAERYLADPGAMGRRLATDLDRVSLLGREVLRLDLDRPAEQLVADVREGAERIGFRTPVAAAAAVGQRFPELPYDERRAGEPIGAYHRSAGRTVAEGEVVRELMRLDGGVDLVFQRLAQEPNATAVRLEATVRVEQDGTAYLERYGWPSVALDQPVVAFDGPAGGYLTELVEDLRAAAEAHRAAGGPDDPGHRAAAGLFEQAMLMALGALVTQSRPQPGAPPQPAPPRSAPPQPAPPQPASPQAYQQEVFRLVTQAPLLLVDYLEGVFDLAERGDAAGWAAGCVRRSAAEALFGDYLGSAAFEVVERDALAELDRTLADTAEELAAQGEPLAPPPAGVPSWHTWWRG